MQTSVATTAAFVNIAGKIQAPVVAAPVLPQANVSTVTTTTTAPIVVPDVIQITPVVVPDVVQIVPVVQ